MSAKNLINFVRFILACVLLIDHLKKPVKYFSKDFSGVLYITLILKYLSAIILIGRYFYQFFPVFSIPTTGLLVIGIDVYNVSDLYTTIILDTCLFLAGRYSYDLLKDQKDSRRHRFTFDWTKYYKL